MWNLRKDRIMSAVVGALVISAGVATTANAEIVRLSGKDRYSTSDEIVKAGWSKGAETAILASGLDANKVDALTVAPLAKAKNAPVVLVNPNDSVATIVAKFKGLNVKTLYIANGTGVISSQVDEELKKAGIKNIIRVGGINRYATALNIAKELGSSNSIVIASGDDSHLVDALSIASIAAAKGMPIFLAGSSLDGATSDYINKLGSKTTYVLGGSSVVPDSAVKKLPGVVRLAGSERYETNAKVVDTFKTDASLKLNNIFIASGENENIIDALAGAPLAGSMGAPIVFVHDTINPSVNTLLKSIVNGTTKITILGGIGAVTPAANYAINTIQTGVNNNTAVKFSDKNLEKAIRDTIKKPSGDILKSDVEKITTLNVSRSNIVTLSGMENLTNLTCLNLYYNKIDDISAISKLTNLTYLDLNNNEIKDISAINGLTNLTYLNLSGNQIKDISAISGLTNLNDLYLNYNKISNISAVSKLTNLTELGLNNNEIKDISAISGLTNLTYLNLANNQISDISAISGLNKLTTLHLSNNQIKDYSPTKSYYGNLKTKDFTI